MFTPAEEHDTLQRAMAGDAAALTRLLEVHGPTVRGRIAADMPRRWQAVLSVDDVLQQAYTDAFLAIRRFIPHGDGAFLAWLTKLAKNAMLDAIDMLNAAKRGGERRQVMADPERSLTALFDAVVGASQTPSQVVAGGEALSAMRRALETLPPVYRTVIDLYDLQEKSADDAAAAIGKSVGAMYMVRARAHRRLAEIMGDRSQFLST